MEFWLGWLLIVSAIILISIYVYNKSAENTQRNIRIFLKKNFFWILIILSYPLAYKYMGNYPQGQFLNRPYVYFGIISLLLISDIKGLFAFFRYKTPKVVAKGIAKPFGKKITTEKYTYYILNTIRKNCFKWVFGKKELLIIKNDLVHTLSKKKEPSSPDFCNTEIVPMEYEDLNDEIKGDIKKFNLPKNHIKVGSRELIKDFKFKEPSKEDVEENKNRLKSRLYFLEKLTKYAQERTEKNYDFVEDAKTRARAIEMLDNSNFIEQMQKEGAELSNDD